MDFEKVVLHPNQALPLKTAAYRIVLLSSFGAGASLGTIKTFQYTPPRTPPTASGVITASKRPSGEVTRASSIRSPPPVVLSIPSLHAARRQRTKMTQIVITAVSGSVFLAAGVFIRGWSGLSFSHGDTTERHYTIPVSQRRVNILVTRVPSSRRSEGGVFGWCVHAQRLLRAACAVFLSGNRAPTEFRDGNSGQLMIFAQSVSI